MQNVELQNKCLKLLSRKIMRVKVQNLIMNKNLMERKVNN